MKEVSQKLIDELRAGKSEAYAQLYELYYEPVYVLTYGILQNHADAEDAVQQTFIRVYRKLPTLKNDDAFSVWLMKIANNEALMLLRKRRPEADWDETAENIVLDQDQGEWMLPHILAERRDTAEELRRIIARLPEKQRETLVLHYFHDLKVKEIAEVMECTESAVKSRLRYARSFVSREVEELERKQGERLRFGAMAPFGEVITHLLRKTAQKKRRKAVVWKRITPAVYDGSAFLSTAAATTKTGIAVKIAAGAAVLFVAATGIVGIAGGFGGNGGEEKGGSFYGGSGQQQEQGYKTTGGGSQVSQKLDSNEQIEKIHRSFQEESDYSLSSKEMQLIDEINRLRIKDGKEPFEISEEMCEYAVGYANDASKIRKATANNTDVTIEDYPYYYNLTDEIQMNQNRWIIGDISQLSNLKDVANEWYKTIEGIDNGKIGVSYDVEEACWGILLDCGDPRAEY